MTVFAADEPLRRLAVGPRPPRRDLDATVEHLRLTVIAVVVGFVLPSLLSVVALRWRWTFAPITWVTGVLYTIPSLALFALLVPITGLGTTLTAEIALVSYTLLILVRNIVAGVDGVPAVGRRCRRRHGLHPSRRFLRVELPLATPAIIAGLRIATVTTVGLVTVTALIGLGGYGDFINDGPRPPVPDADHRRRRRCRSLMAVVLDLVLVGLERVLTPWRRSRPRQLVARSDAPIGGLPRPTRRSPSRE